MDPRVAANRDNWNDRTPVHLRSDFYDVEGWVRDAPGPRARELEMLGDVSGLSLLHLQCHFGLDAMQFARAGARATGLDFSPVAIDAACELAERVGLADRVDFVCADVHDASSALGGRTFDVVYVSLGALTWIPSVDRWAQEAARLVAPGGRFYLHDGHPLAWALADDDLRFEYTYFEEPDALVNDVGDTYTGGGERMAHPRTYEWNHSLGEIVTAFVRHGLRLDWLQEHDWTGWPRLPSLVPGPEGQWGFPPGGPRYPLSFSLLATRAAPALPAPTLPSPTL